MKATETFKGVAAPLPTTAQPHQDKFRGVKFDSMRSTKDCAAGIRADIKAAVKAGTLPKGTYSVAMRGGRNSIDVRISDLPFVILQS